MKRCEVCEIKIPEDYINLLCDGCYQKHIEIIERQKAEVARVQHEEMLKNPSSPQHPDNLASNSPVEPSDEPASTGTLPSTENQTTVKIRPKNAQGILDPAYETNPEADDKNQILANLAQFIYTHRDSDHPKGAKKGILLYYPQRNMYTFVRNYCLKKSLAHPQSPANGGKHIWKPKVVDVGCGSGVGANIISQEADFVWGIDKNEWSIEFAKEAFTREKNSIYYTPQLTFDVFDVVGDSRETMKFDAVVMIEVIEHIEDVDAFLRAVIKKFTKRDKRGDAHVPNESTDFFISTPNRNSPKIRKDKPENIYHVREWTAFEIHALLKEYFEEVELMNTKGEPITTDAVDDVVFAKCTHPRV
jgi:2-polyprenyl-3-methyl-5-hydroxy-6-metoxy-1,4-benzoquinol methylase